MVHNFLARVMVTLSLQAPFENMPYSVTFITLMLFIFWMGVIAWVIVSDVAFGREHTSSNEKKRPHDVADCHRSDN